MGDDIYFWTTSGEYGYLSNFFGCKFIMEYNTNFELINGEHEMCCSEQAFMIEKAIVFLKNKEFQKYNIEIIIKLFNEKNPSEIKKLGRKIKGFDEERWKRKREKCMYNVLYAKFQQNPKLLEKLKSTKNSKLIEASPYDAIWGIGYDKKKMHLLIKTIGDLIS